MGKSKEEGTSVHTSSFSFLLFLRPVLSSPLSSYELTYLHLNIELVALSSPRHRIYLEAKDELDHSARPTRSRAHQTESIPPLLSTHPSPILPSTLPHALTSYLPSSLYSAIYAARANLKPLMFEVRFFPSFPLPPPSPSLRVLVLFRLGYARQRIRCWRTTHHHHRCRELPWIPQWNHGT